MAKIELTQGYWVTIDDEILEWVNQWKWCAHRPGYYQESRIYVRAVRRENNKIIIMHRAIWEHLNGPIPKGYTVDHREHGEYGGLDNRIGNLRLASATQQVRNRRGRKESTSRFKGISLIRSSGKWRARIKYNDKFCHIGCYNSEHEAAFAYDRTTIEYFGEFAVTNFPQIQNGRWVAY